MARHRVQKGRAAKQFGRSVSKTKSINVARPGRGGFRL